MSIFLILVLIIVPLVAFADNSGTFKDINWSLDKKGNLILEGGGTIPAEGPWQTYSKEIKNVVIGDGISRIERYAFKSLKNLKTVTLGKDVVILEEDAFSECKNLKSVTLLGEKTILEGKSFFSSGFSELNLPENSNYTIVDNCVLANNGKTLVYCLGGKNVVVPDGVEKIASGAFWCNKSTVTVSLPDTLEKLEESALGNCDKLESICIPASVNRLSSNSFWDCTNLKELTFCGDKLTIDGLSAFGFCGKLKKVVLPAVTFTGIDSYQNRNSSTFGYCTNLETFAFGEGTEEIPGKFFYDCPKLQNVFVPASITRISDTAFNREAKKLVIRCIKGSFAEQFAKENGYKYEYYKPVQSIVLSEKKLSLKTKKAASLTYTIEPADFTVKDIMWISSNDRIATVKKGKVQAIAIGECDIICQAMDGSGVRTICHLVVE